MLLLVKLQTKRNTPPKVFFTFLKLYMWYQITRRITLHNPEISQPQDFDDTEELNLSNQKNVDLKDQNN